ncbi:MAG TPA: BON domain-containing protein [Verrucomicrobiae bacterium]|nr:BON domain-containing protein [Verrucomicrobiae bacterium]
MKNNFAKGFLTLAFAAIAFVGAPEMAKAAAPLRPFAQPSPDYNAGWLEQQVRHKLSTLPWYSVFDILQYRIDGDTVTLSGKVVLPIVKSDAVGAVKSIEGVRVVDRIQLLPVSPFDTQVRRQEYRSIFSYPPLSRYSMGVNPQIHIIVDNGNVTLVGSVSSQADKDAAGLRAKLVPDTFKVTNDLTVEG